MEQWTTIWPQKEGWYWFYGDRYSEERNVLFAVQVWKTKNSYAYVTNGTFIYPSEATGIWLPITTPEIPDVNQFTI